MTDVFVDTWAWYALADPNDSDHAKARKALDTLLAEGDVLVTTNFVMAEAVTLIRYHLYHVAAVRFHETLQELIDIGVLHLVRVTDTHEAAAWALFCRFDDQKLSYTDCLSFAVMRDLKIERVISGDHHFAVLGFILVP